MEPHDEICSQMMVFEQLASPQFSSSVLYSLRGNPNKKASSVLGVPAYFLTPQVMLSEKLTVQHAKHPNPTVEQRD
jgi:hypothetical protein